MKADAGDHPRQSWSLQALPSRLRMSESARKDGVLGEESLSPHVDTPKPVIATPWRIS